VGSGGDRKSESLADAENSSFSGTLIFVHYLGEYMENDTKKELEEDKKTAPVSEKKEEASSKKRDNPNKKTSVWTSLFG
jgi:hypothetical protein